MAASIRQHANAENAGSGSNIACTFASPVLAGNAIVAFGSIGNNNLIASCADTVNGSYGTIRLNINDATDGEELGVFLISNVGAGTPTVTITFSAADIFRSIHCVEIDQAALSAFGGVVGQVQNATGTDGVTTGNVTPTGQPALLLGLAMSTGAFPGVAPNFGTGFTDDGTFWQFGGGSDYSRLESKRITSTTPVPATFTQVSNVPHTQIAIVVLEFVVAAAVPTIASAPSAAALTVVEAGRRPVIVYGFGSPPQVGAVVRSVPPPPVPDVFPGRIIAGFGVAPAVARVVVARVPQLVVVPPAPALYSGVAPVVIANPPVRVAQPPALPPVVDLPPRPVMSPGSDYEPGQLFGGVVGSFVPDEPFAPAAPTTRTFAAPVAPPSAPNVVGRTAPPSFDPPARQAIARGAGSPPQTPFVTSPVPPSATVLPPSSSRSSGFGTPPQVAAVVRPVVAPTVPDLPPPVESVPGFGSPPAVATLVSATSTRPVAELPPAVAVIQGAGSPASPAVQAFARLAPDPVVPPPRPSTVAGSGQPSQTPATVVAVPPPPLVELPPRDALFAGGNAPQAGVLSVSYAPRLPLLPDAYRGSITPGAGSPPQVPAQLRTVVPEPAPLPPQDSIFAGVVPPAPPAPPRVVFSVLPPPAAELLTLATLVAGGGVLPSPAPPFVAQAPRQPQSEVVRGFALRLDGAGSPPQVAAVIAAFVPPLPFEPFPRPSLLAGVPPTPPPPVPLQVAVALLRLVQEAPPRPLVLTGAGDAAAVARVVSALQRPVVETPLRAALYPGVAPAVVLPAVVVGPSTPPQLVLLPPPQIIVAGFGAIIPAPPFVAFARVPPVSVVVAGVSYWFPGFGDAVPPAPPPAVPVAPPERTAVSPRQTLTARIGRFDPVDKEILGSFDHDPTADDLVYTLDLMQFPWRPGERPASAALSVVPNDHQFKLGASSIAETFKINVRVRKGGQLGREYVVRADVTTTLGSTFAKGIRLLMRTQLVPLNS